MTTYIPPNAKCSNLSEVAGSEEQQCEACFNAESSSVHSGACGDCHGDTGAEMTTDGTGLCIECRKGADLGEESESEDDGDDQSSVHSTCCHECGESFPLEPAVSYEEYMAGKHDMTCESCLEAK